MSTTQPTDQISTSTAPKTNPAPAKPGEKKPPTEQEILIGYNETKQKYSLYFQKSLEIESELFEHK